MKKVIFTICAVLVLQGMAMAQSTGKNSSEYKRQHDIYKRALAYNDYSVAKSAIYEMMSLDPNDHALQDTLALMYFDFKQYASAILVSNDVLKSDPNNLRAIEIKAISFDNLQIYDRALEQYEALHIRNSDLYTLYKIAFLQFRLQRFVESETSAKLIMDNAESQDLKVYFNANNSLASKEVPMRAAILNLKGLIYMSQEKKDEARKFFNESIAMAPEFELPKNNLAELDK